MTQSLRVVISQFLKRAGLEKGVAQNRALIVWDSVVGAVIADNTEPEEVNHGVLTIRVKTPAWRQELQFQKADIINKLNAQLGNNTIKEIRFI
ncbi:MAG: DciA family protein [Fidelibacterota bacterium]